MKREGIGRVRIALVVMGLVGVGSAACGATLYVSNRGVDSPSCGPAAERCRSITRAIANASPGDTVMAGPGRYGDLNGNGVLGEPGEETPAAFCLCMLAIDKPLIVLSSDGAAATVIDGTTAKTDYTVYISADGEFGRPNHGFTVTQTGKSQSNGILVHTIKAKIRGNQVAASLRGVPNPEDGIGTVDNDIENILIESNQVTGWNRGIVALGASKTISKNQVTGNETGIFADTGSPASGNISITGNVAAGNLAGIQIDGAVSVVGNAVVGNRGIGIFVTAFSPFVGAISKNSIFGNGTDTPPAAACGLLNVGVTGLAATNNYWGSPAGPGLDPADGICNDFGSTTIFLPFSTKPFTVNPEFEP